MGESVPSNRIVLIIKDVMLEDFSLLEPEFHIVKMVQKSFHLSIPQLESILPQVEAIIATGPVNSALIAKALSLKCIVANGAGYDDIDIAAATACGVPVYNIPGPTTHPTAELALTLMLTLSRRVSELDRKLRKPPAVHPELFATGANPGHTLEGKQLGIIGFGRIGKDLSRMAKALRMEVVYTNHRKLETITEYGIHYSSFENLLKTSDVISVNCPLTMDTRKMIDRDAFLKMKKNVILINTSRGAVIDQEQMIKFLEAGRIAGAALDVFPNEPIIHPKLLKMDNVVLTPHIGTNTPETRTQMANEIIRVVRAVCNGTSDHSGNLINHGD